MRSIGSGLFLEASKDSEGSVIDYNIIDRFMNSNSNPKRFCPPNRKKVEEGDQRTMSGVSKSKLNYMHDIIKAPKTLESGFLTVLGYIY